MRGETPNPAAATSVVTYPDSARFPRRCPPCSPRYRRVGDRPPYGYPTPPDPVAKRLRSFSSVALSGPNARASFAVRGRFLLHLVYTEFSNCRPPIHPPRSPGLPTHRTGEMRCLKTHESLPVLVRCFWDGFWRTSGGPHAGYRAQGAGVPITNQAVEKVVLRLVGSP